jgi:type VI secretion system secreted protein Hcp
MATDYLLVIEGIQGESLDSKFKESIEIDSFGWGASHPGSFAFGTGGATGKVNFQDMQFSIRANKASPNLMLAVATGKHIGKATLRVRKATGDSGQQEYYTVEMTDVLVSSYQSSGHAGDHSIPTEQFSLNFAKIEFQYKPQDAKGTLGAAITAKYDIGAQTK